MGYHTLGGQGSLSHRVAADLMEPIILQCERGDTVHTLVAEGATGAEWVVSLVRLGMVKHMSEFCGPYCEPPTREFYDRAIARIPTTHGYGAEFRARMAEAVFA